MHEDEFERLKSGFRTLPIRDEAGRTRLTNELENVVRSVLDEKAAERYVKQIKDVDFYPMMVWSGGPDNVPRTWPQGCEKMVAVIDSIEHSIRFSTRTAASSTRTGVNMNKVFIVHGRDHGMLNDVKTFLYRIDVEPIVLMDEANEGGTVIEKFERHADVPFAIVLFSPDDEGRDASEPNKPLKRRPRQNAVIELGFFIGKLGRKGTALMVDGRIDAAMVEYPSDVAGVIPIYYKPESDWKLLLLRELRVAKIEHDGSKV
jgi:predicted nucleotide-binding protein